MEPVDLEVLTDLIANANAQDFNDAELGEWVRCYVNQISEAVHALAQRAGQ